MSNKLVVLLSSPRKKGNSATLAQQVVTGALAAGAQVERFFLHDMNLRPCNACDACLKTLEPACVIEDDMQILYPKLTEADAIVLASPIYWFTVSAQAKLFMDRLYAFEGPGRNLLADKRFAYVLTYGDSDPFNSGAVNALRTFQDAFSYTGSTIVGMVHGSADKAGEIKSNKKLMVQAEELGKELTAG